MFTNINDTELMDIDGGFIVTGAMIIKGVGLIVAGVTVGTAVGKTIKGIFS